MAIEVFNRTETKYLLTDQQKNNLLSIIGNYMNSDPFNKDGKTYPISNLYMDSDSDELIVRSLEKPIFKEKIRIRSYGTAKMTDTVFLESKKKFNQVVNKRRTCFTLQEVYDYLETGKIPDNPKLNRQVLSEIDYIIKFYSLKPKVYISYDRLAFFEKDDSDFRLTVDTNIQTRRDNLRLEIPASGEQLLPPGTWLMEAKAYKAFPLWFAEFLSENNIYSSSFSKYGTEYQKYILNKNK